VFSDVFFFDSNREERYWEAEQKDKEVEGISTWKKEKEHTINIHL
jgi:hypothetical protein